MSTAHEYRFTCACPVTSFGKLNLFLHQNLDPIGGPWLTPTLSSDGQPPSTHGWFSAAMTAREFTDFTAYIFSEAALPMPPTWEEMTQQERIDHVNDQQDEIYHATDILIRAASNLGEWGSPDEALEAMGLKQTTPASEP